MKFSTDSRLTGCLLATHLPVKAELRRRPELAGVPLIVTTGELACPMVLDASPEAAGVVTGQTVAAALSLCQGAVTLTADAGCLDDINDSLLSALWDVAPAVERAGLGVFYLDLTGLAGVYGGRDGLADALLSTGEAWLRPRLGIASGRFPAWCAATRAEAGGWREVPDNVDGWLAPFAVSSLPLDSRVAARLEAFGVRTLGDVAKLPLTALEDYLGPAGPRAWQLARGIDPEPVVPTPLPERLSERLEFPFPVDTEPAIEAGVTALAERLWRSPALRARQVGEATLHGELLSGGDWRFQRDLRRRPAGSADALVRSLLSGLGARDSGGDRRWPRGSLLDLSLTAAGFTSESGRQATIWRKERVVAAGDIPGVDRLAALVPESALPERRWALGAALRPLNLPAKAAVDTARGVPRRVRTDDTRWRPVEQVADLWEVDTEWWTLEPVRRRYWRLALADGGLLTVYRDLDTGEWYRQDY